MRSFKDRATSFNETIKELLGDTSRFKTSEDLIAALIDACDNGSATDLSWEIVQLASENLGAPRVDELLTKAGDMANPRELLVSFNAALTDDAHDIDHRFALLPHCAKALTRIKKMHRQFLDITLPAAVQLVTSYRIPDEDDDDVGIGGIAGAAPVASGIEALLELCRTVYAAYKSADSEMSEEDVNDCALAFGGALLQTFAACSSSQVWGAPQRQAVLDAMIEQVEAMGLTVAIARVGLVTRSMLETKMDEGQHGGSLERGLRLYAVRALAKGRVAALPWVYHPQHLYVQFRDHIVHALRMRLHHTGALAVRCVEQLTPHLSGQLLLQREDISLCNLMCGHLMTCFDNTERQRVLDTLVAFIDGPWRVQADALECYAALIDSEEVHPSIQGRLLAAMRARVAEAFSSNATVAKAVAADGSVGATVAQPAAFASPELVDLLLRNLCDGDVAMTGYKGRPIHPPQDRKAWQSSLISGHDRHAATLNLLRFIIVSDDANATGLLSPGRLDAIQKGVVQPLSEVLDEHVRLGRSQQQAASGSDTGANDTDGAGLGGGEDGPFDNATLLRCEVLSSVAKRVSELIVERREAKGQEQMTKTHDGAALNRK